MADISGLRVLHSDPVGALWDAPQSNRLLRGVLPAAGGLLCLGDIAAYAMAFALVSHLDAYAAVGRPARDAILLAAVCLVILNASAGLYPGYRLHAHEVMRRRVLVVFKVGAITSAGTLILLRDGSATALIAAFLAGAALLQPVPRFALRRLAHWLGCWGEAAEIIGLPGTAAKLRDYFERNWWLGVCPVSVSTQEMDDKPTSDRTGCARIALVVDGAASDRDSLTRLRNRYHEIILLADTPEIAISGLRPSDLDGFIGLRLAGTVSSWATPRRVLDLAIAAFAVLCCAPVIIFACVAIWLVDPGPVIYRQEREGLGGRKVSVLKLRTMFRDAEHRLEVLLRDNPGARAEWDTHFKLRNDPRILPVVGKVLRSTSCDELPQLFNVLRGRMSIIGPRPFPAYHLSAMGSAFRAKRRSVLPGITGLLQVSFRSDADLRLQQQIDNFYIDNRSFWLDAHILTKTVSAVFRRSGT